MVEARADVTQMQKDFGDKTIIKQNKLAEKIKILDELKEIAARKM